MIPETDAPSRLSETESEQQGSVPPPSRPLSVLVVEDDRDLRAEISELLQNDGYRVFEAAHGGQALDLLAAEQNIDLILLDLWMPTMDGWTFRVKQKSNPAFRDVPVIVLSADDGPPARAIDADAFLRKPFEADQLGATVRHVISERRADLRESADLVSRTVALLSNAVSHEVANPLMALISGLEQRRERGDASPEEKPPLLDEDQLLEQCWRIADALKTLRTLPFPTWSREDETPIARHVRAALATIRHESLRIDCDLDEDAKVHGDPLVLLYVCATILHHAIESFPSALDDGEAEPHVRVHLTRVDASVVLDVTDRGPHIPDEDIEQIFTVSYCGRMRAWSAGLRLWWVHRAVEGLGGTVTLKNRKPVGVRCRVSLPAVGDEAARRPAQATG